MTTNATVVLDSGAFLSALPESGIWDIGYFASKMSTPSIRIYSDGKEISTAQNLDVPTGGATLEVQLTEGEILKKGISVDNNISLYGLTWEQLYDDLYAEKKQIDVDRTKFDCVIRFHSGYFRASMVKARRFKLQPAPPPANPGDKWTPPVAHNVVVHYTIADTEELKLVTGGRPMWSSGDHPNSAANIEIEIVADHSTATQFYCDCLTYKGPFWLPNQGDPTPVWPPNK
jgi:hypothetical protein